MCEQKAWICVASILKLFWQRLSIDTVAHIHVRTNIATAIESVPQRKHWKTEAQEQRERECAKKILRKISCTLNYHKIFARSCVIMFIQRTKILNPNWMLRIASQRHIFSGTFQWILWPKLSLRMCLDFRFSFALSSITRDMQSFWN